MIATVEIQHPDLAPVHVGPFPSEHAAKTWLTDHPERLRSTRLSSGRVVHILSRGRIAHIVILRSPESAAPEPSHGKEVTSR